MNYNIVFSGVGGQGVLSLATLIAAAAVEDGLTIKQSEVHGMSQRGGAVMATLRLANREIHSPLVPMGSASLLLSMEPMESLRYLEYLSAEGALITAAAAFRNIPDYPPLETVHAKIRTVPHAILLDADQLAREAGSVRAANVVLVGAASKFIPIREATLEGAIRHVFERKGSAVVDMNLKAFHLGREAVKAV